MKKPQLEKVKGKKIGGRPGLGGKQDVTDRREQALARKRELLENARKSKLPG